ncbi:MAG: hypothetical protein ACP5NQ_09030, partial [Vulcanisaeta sp.]
MMQTLRTSTRTYLILAAVTSITLLCMATVLHAQETIPANYTILWERIIEISAIVPTPNYVYASSSSVPDVIVLNETGEVTDFWTDN